METAFNTSRDQPSNIPWTVISHDWKAELDINALNEALAELPGKGKLVDLSELIGGDDYVYIVTLATDQHTAEEWHEVFHEYLETR